MVQKVPNPPPIERRPSPSPIPPKPIPVARPWTDEYMTLVEDCEKRKSRLTEWEASFIDSIRHRLEKALPLSPKQTETLDSIWERVTANG